MKNIFNPLATVAVIMLGASFSSCCDYDWTNTHDTVLSPFEIITGDITVDLTAEEPMTVELNWNPSVSNDQTMVFYSVLFSTTPDMANVFYQVETLNYGVENKLSIPPSDLNIIAELGDIPQNSQGTIYWTVEAGTGVAEIINDKVSKLTVTRPDGYAYNPEHLFIEVAGGEYLPMRKLSDGVFELFTELGTGEYKIAERISVSKTRYFSISGDKLAQGGSVKAPKSGSVTHIKVDFNTSEAVLSSVDKVSLLYQGDKDNPVELQRLAGATWCGDYHFTREGNTYTYKFIVDETTAGGEHTTAYYGYVRSSSVSQTANSPEDYFYLYSCPDDGNSYCFRFGNANNFQLDKDLRITVNFETDAEDSVYTHSIEVL